MSKRRKYDEFNYFGDYYSGFPKYVSVKERKNKSLKAFERLKNKNSYLNPVFLEGSIIAKSWWGKAWCKNLELYADYQNRIGRGRSYLRQGSVIDLKISEGMIVALVQGSQRNPYSVAIRINQLDAEVWQTILKTCSGKIETMQELLNGNFPKDMGELFTLKGQGMFPSPKEITFDCSCPDSAYMCKHVAAVLYGVGARLDHDPNLFFTLRKITVNNLISETVKKKTGEMLEKAQKKTKRMMQNPNLSDVFGIDISGDISEKSKMNADKVKANKINKKSLTPANSSDNSKTKQKIQIAKTRSANSKKMPTSKKPKVMKSSKTELGKNKPNLKKK